MKDTLPEITQKMREMFQERTAQERLISGCSMYDFAKQLVVSSLLQENPELPSHSLRRALFLRFYGNDFDHAQRKKIIQHFDFHKGDS